MEPHSVFLYVCGGVHSWNVNVNGHSGTLVASHPGNQNAVKHGVYSPRLIEARAVEIEAELEEKLDLSSMDRLALAQLARLEATLEAIDRDLQQRGHIDSRGKPNPLLSYQLRIFRRYEALLAAISSLQPRNVAGKDETTPLPRVEIAVEASGTEIGHRRVKVAQALEREIRADKPNGVRVSALVALDRIRRQPALRGDEEESDPLFTVYDLAPGSNPVLHRARPARTEPDEDRKPSTCSTDLADRGRPQKVCHFYYVSKSRNDSLSGPIGSFEPPNPNGHAVPVVSTEDPETAALWRAELAAGRLPQVHEQDHDRQIR